MSLWQLLGLICLAGGVGGLINSLISDNGFLLPKAEKNDGTLIIRPGFIGNIAIGAVAASVSWGLYGPLSLTSIVPGPGASAQYFGMSLSALFGAVLVGVGGARWLTNEVDKKLLKTAASMAADVAASPGASNSSTSKKNRSKDMMTVSPARALSIAKEMQAEEMSSQESLIPTPS